MRISPKSPHRTLLNIEPLEDRTVPSAASAFATDRLLITFADSAPTTSEVAQLSAPPIAKAVKSLGLGIYSVDLVAGANFQKAITIFSALPGVQSVSRDSVVSVASTPNDPQLGSQWNLSTISAAQAWNATTGTGQTIVAVIDTGVDLTHPDLVANLWTNTIDPATGGLHGYDFSANDTNPQDEAGHGTHVAGILGAAGNNGVGVSGVDQHAKIMALRFMDANGNGYTSDAVRAMDYAIRHGAKILNNSWGGSAADPTLAAAIERARAAGVIVVVAAGNDSANDDTTATYPAYYARQSNNVVLVASTNSNDQLSYFSNYGAQTVMVAAPGENILSTTLGGGYGLKSGTSMATPVISGALALLWDLHPTWSYTQILDKLKTSVDTSSGLTGKVTSGGRIDLAKLLDASVTVPSVTVPPVTVPPVTVPPVSTSPNLRWEGGGPKVISAVFGGSNSTSYNTVRVSFDKKINAPTFTASDVELTGPNGKLAVAGIAVVANSNNSIFDISFESQTATGTYTVKIGPDIWDVQAHRMNQNGNGVDGEATDAYSTTARIGTATSPPPATSPPITAAKKTYAATATNVPIADQRTTRIAFNVSDAFSISNLTVNLDLTHSRMTDLNIRLVAPDGSHITLFNRRSLNLAGITFDDTSATSLSVGSLSRGATVRPEQLLSAFSGKAAKGTWTLEIFDLFAGATGTVKSASLSFATNSAKAATIPATSGLSQFAAVDHSVAVRPDAIAVKAK